MFCKYHLFCPTSTEKGHWRPGKSTITNDFVFQTKIDFSRNKTHTHFHMKPLFLTNCSFWVNTTNTNNVQHQEKTVWESSSSPNQHLHTYVYMSLHCNSLNFIIMAKRKRKQKKRRSVSLAEISIPLKLTQLSN